MVPNLSDYRWCTSHIPDRLHSKTARREGEGCWLSGNRAWLTWRRTICEAQLKIRATYMPQNWRVSEEKAGIQQDTRGQIDSHRMNSFLHRMKHSWHKTQVLVFIRVLYWKGPGWYWLNMRCTLNVHCLYPCGTCSSSSLVELARCATITRQGASPCISWIYTRKCVILLLRSSCSPAMNILQYKLCAG